MRIRKRRNNKVRFQSHSKWSKPDKTKMRCHNTIGTSKNPKITFLHGVHPPTMGCKHKLDWKEFHTESANKLKIQTENKTENKHFEIEKQTRVRCDANKKGLRTCLEQKDGINWELVAYASTFLNNQEERYSTNELELFGVVWCLEHFKYYLYGSQFTLQTDHQALLSSLKEYRGNKPYQSRLTRWVDCLLPFHFTVEQG